MHHSLLLTCILTQLNVNQDMLVGAVRDGAAVNGATIRHVKVIMYPDAVDIVCASHTHWTTLADTLKRRHWTSLCSRGSHSFPGVQLPDWSGKSVLAPPSSTVITLDGGVSGKSKTSCSQHLEMCLISSRTLVHAKQTAIACLLF